MDSLDDIFLRARELAEPAERAAWLDQACAGNAELRKRVESMLRDAEGADQFFGKGGTVQVTAGGMLEQAGTVIGRYKLLQKIGEGGMGVVYMAEQREPVVRKVALKIIKLGMDTRQVVGRFEAERQALALMDHPNIAKVLDGGTTESGRPYFVMELVQGLPITQFCDESSLPTAERLRLFLDVCSAVQHAHQKGIIHRDIKPSNILVTLHGNQPVPKVIDFGVAKATQSRLTDKTVFTQFQQFIGTPAYMSPEQTSLSGLDVDTRSDIYSLGVLLYELLTGKTPFDAKELLKVGLDQMRQIIREKEPPKPSTRLSTLEGDDLTTTARQRHAEPPKLVHQVRGDLDWIVMKCLEKDRARRYETANGLAMDLQRHLANEPVAARPPSAIYRMQKAIRRNRVVFAAVGAIGVVLVLGSIVSTWQAVRATRAERKAKEQTEAALRLQGSIDYDRNLYRDLWRARGYENAGRTNEAIELFARLRPQLASAFPQHRADCEEVAKFFVRHGHYEDAKAAFEPVRASLEKELPKEPTDFQRLVEATAASKGWPVAAETCRKYFDLLSREPIAWRTKAITLLYAGDEQSYANAANAAIAVADSTTNWEDLVAILETSSIGVISFSAEQTNIILRASERVRAGLTPEREGRGRAAMAAVLFRLRHFDESLKQTQIALAWQLDRMGTARLCALGGLCRYRLGDADAGYGNFITGESNTRFTPLWNLEALGEAERFLTESERCYLILRREELATIPGTRVDSLARQGRFKEAVEVALQSIELEPTNRWHYHSLAPLLAVDEHSDGYGVLCKRISSQFKDTRDLWTAQTMANACLILPASGADPLVISNLVRVVSNANSLRLGDQVFAWFTMGLAAYRQGNFSAATNWTQRAIDFAASGGGNNPYVEARMVLAMARFQLRATNEARLTLSEGIRLAAMHADGQARGDLGYDWRARLRDKAVMKEAQALIEKK